LRDYKSRNNKENVYADVSTWKCDASVVDNNEQDSNAT